MNRPPATAQNTGRLGERCSAASFARTLIILICYAGRLYKCAFFCKADPSVYGTAASAAAALHGDGPKNDCDPTDPRIAADRDCGCRRSRRANQHTLVHFIG